MRQIVWMFVSWVGGTAVLLLLATTGRHAALAQAAPSCTGDNLLANGSFEGAYVPYVMDAPGHPDCQTWDPDAPNQFCERVKAAPDWHPWWRDAPRSESWMNIQPEYVPSLPHESPPRVRSGEKSQHYFSFWTTHDAGLYQQVDAVPGGSYCFSVYGHAWSSRKTLPGYISDPTDHGFLRQQVGIDPTGGTDWQSPDIVWSDARMQYDEFGEFVIETTAQADQITVFLRSAASVPVKHNDVYWDDALLTIAQEMTVSPESLAALVDVDAPQTQTLSLAVEVTPALAWTAVLDPSGALTPTLDQTAGVGSAVLTVTIDSSGYAVGSYTTTLTLDAGAETTGSPADIPITLHVAEEIINLYLPAMRSK